MNFVSLVLGTFPATQRSELHRNQDAFKSEDTLNAPPGVYQQLKSPPTKRQVGIVANISSIVKLDACDIRSSGNPRLISWFPLTMQVNTEGVDSRATQSDQVSEEPTMKYHGRGQR